MLKFFKSLKFPDHLIELVHIWYGDRYSSKVLFSNTPAHYHKVKVMDLEKFLKLFKGSYFPNYMMDFVRIWYDDRHSSKVLFSSTLPMPMTQGQGHRLKNVYIKVFKELIFTKPYDGFCHICYRLVSP